jgi:hypothetical protein
MVPCLFSIFTLPLIFLVCRALTRNVRASLIAVLIAAINPFQIYYAQELKSYSLYLMLALAAFYCFLKFLENGQARYCIGLTIIETISMYSHFFSVWNITLFNLFFLFTIRRNFSKLPKWIVSQGLMTILVLPAVLLAKQWAAIYESTKNPWSARPDLKSAMLTFKTFFAGYDADARLYWCAFIFALVLFVYGLISLRRRKSDLALILMLTILPIAANVLIWRSRACSFYEHRVFIFSAAICYCVVAHAITSLPWKALRVVVLAAFCGIAAPLLRDYYSQNMHADKMHLMGARYKVQNREAAAYIYSCLQEGDFVAHASTFTLFPFYYYLPDAKQAALRLSEEELRGFLDGIPSDTLWRNYGALPVRAEQAVEGARRVWFVESWWEPFATPPIVIRMREWMDKHFICEESREFDGISVYEYLCDPALILQTEWDCLADFGNHSLEQVRLPGNDRHCNLGGKAIDESKRMAQKELGVLSVRLDFEVNEKPCAPGLPMKVKTATLQDGSITTNAVFRENAGSRRVIECQAYAAARVVEPREFTFAPPYTDAWTCSEQFHGDRYKAGSGAPGLVAHLTKDSPSESLIYKDLQLPGGTYSVFAWALRTGDAKNASRATARFLMTSPPDSPEQTLIGSVCPNIPEMEWGWTWFCVGELKSDGAPMRLAVAAVNKAKLPNAYFDMGEIVFVEHSGRPAFDRLDVLKQTFEMAPYSEKTFPISLPALKGENNMVSFSFWDSVMNDARTLRYRFNDRAN